MLSIKDSLLLAKPSAVLERFSGDLNNMPKQKLRHNQIKKLKQKLVIAVISASNSWQKSISGPKQKT